MIIANPYRFEQSSLLDNVKEYWPLISNSNGMNGNNGTDTSMSYSDGGDFQNMADFTAGTSSKISVADADVLSFGNGTTDEDFSISFRCSFSSLPSVLAVLFIKNSTSNTNAEYSCYYQLGTDNLSFRRFDASTGAFRLRQAASLGITTSTVYWFVITYKQSTDDLKIYLDGVSQSITSGGSGTYTAMENLGEPLTIGKNNANTTQSLDGYLGELIYFDKELTTDDIAYIANRYSNNLPFN